MLSTTFWYLVPHFESIRYFTLGTLQKLASWSIVCTWQMGAFSCTIFPSLGHHCDGHRANIMPNLFILPFSSKHVCHVRLCNMLHVHHCDRSWVVVPCWLRSHTALYPFTSHPSQSSYIVLLLPHFLSTQHCIKPSSQTFSFCSRLCLYLIWGCNLF